MLHLDKNILLFLFFSFRFFSACKLRNHEDFAVDGEGSSESAGSQTLSASNSISKPYLGIKVLMYHDIPVVASPAAEVPGDDFSVSDIGFKTQLDFLVAQGYKSLTIDEYVSLVIAAQKKPSNQDQTKDILITFDDGYLSAFTVAKPELEKRSMKAVFFVPTGFTGNDGTKLASKLAHMSLDQLKDLDGHPLFDVHNHTRNHASLTKES